MLRNLMARLFGRGEPEEVQIPPDAWRELCRDQPEFAGLSTEECERARVLAGRFLAGRPFYGGDRFVPDDAMQMRIAGLAVLPVLELGLDWLADIRSVIVYPDAFHVDHEEVDEVGVVHHVNDLRAGEAWSHGTLVLSWTDIEAGLDLDHGLSVVIHEVAHFLDGVNGAENGFPPLARGQSRTQWTQAFQAGFDRLNRQIDAGEPTGIDPYAGSHPAEFFAVLSEYFFRRPEALQHFDATIYGLLEEFFRQDPLGRRAGRQGASERIAVRD